MKTINNSFITYISIIALLIIAVAMFFEYLKYDFDDAYILYRIVRNIINGYGWTYNINESHNASTSVLNTVLITIFTILTNNIRLSAHIVSGLAILGAGLIGYQLFRSQFGNSIALLLGYFLIRHLGNNLTWGVESNLFICFTLLFVLYEKHHKNSWPLLGLLALTRPDGMLMIGLRWINRFIFKKSYSIKGLLIVLIILAPWLIFSLCQFHQLLPDTFSQKVWQGHSGYWGTGLVYLKGLVRYYIKSSDLLLKVTIGLVPIGIIQMLRDRSQFLYIVFFVLLQQIAYIFLNVPLYHWYISLPNALILISAFYTLGSFFNKTKKRLSLYIKFRIVKFHRLSPKSLNLLSPTVSFAILIITVSNLISAFENPQVNQPDISYTNIIREVDALYGPGRLSSVEVGSIGFNTDRTIVDICGLTSSNGQFLTPDRMDTFFSDPPEILLLHDPVWGHEAAIYRDYRFPVVYKFEKRIPDICIPMQLYIRKDKYDPNNFETQLSEIYESFEPDNRFNSNTLKLLSNGIVTLDAINGRTNNQNQLVVHKCPVLLLQGWAVDIQRHQVPANVFILLINENGQIYSSPAKRHTRKDVAKHLNDPVYDMSGFQVAGLTKYLPPGIYKIQIVQEIEGLYYYVEITNRIHIPENNHNYKYTQ